MAVDSSPLNTGTAIPSGLFTQQNAKQAGSVAGIFAKEQVEEVSRLAKEGDFSIRLFAMVGGLAMAVVSVLGFVARIVTLHWVNALLCVYTFALGVIMVLLEGKKIPFSGKLEDSIVKYALFLKFVWGRGCLYFVAGTLTIAGGGLVEMIVGAFAACVGIGFIVVGRRSATKLAALKKSQFSESTLLAEFNSAAGGGTHMNILQFNVLVENLNVDFNRRELEAAFLQIEKADRDKLSYAEFKSWWDDIDHEVVRV
jgi:hypothetical protein